MKKANKIVYISLGLLLVIVVVLALLNRGDSELRRALEENREFIIRIDGAGAAVVSLQDIIDLEPQEFTTTFGTSVTSPRDTTLQGVELRVLLELLDIDFAGASHITVTGLDSYYSPLTVSEVEQEGVVYICYSMDGEILKTQSDGGYGPFMMVIRGSRFAQRWCKYVEAVDVISS